MMVVLSKEEELSMRRRDFGKLRPGCLFDLSQERFFILVKFIDDRVRKPHPDCLVIELIEANRRRILAGQPAKTTTLSFDEMSCLNLRMERETPDDGLTIPKNEV